MAFDSPNGIVAAAVVLSVLSTLAVFSRFHSRRIQKAGNGWDDWFVLAALVMTLAINALIIWGCVPPISALGNIDAGQQIATSTTPREKAGWANRIYFVTLCISVGALGCLKFSVALMYRRIFTTKIGLQTWWDRVVIAWLVLIVVWTIGFICATLLQCGTRIYLMWDEGSQDNYYRYCSHDLDIYWAYFSTDVAMDIITLLIPLPKVYTLRLPLARKFQLAIVLLVALMSVGASIGILVTYAQIYFGLYESNGISVATTLTVWHMIELDVGIVAACLPACRPIMGRMSQASSSVANLLSLRSLNRFSSNRSVQRSGANDTEVSADDWDVENKAPYVRAEAQGGALSTPSSSSRNEGADTRILMHHEISVEGHQPREL